MSVWRKISVSKAGTSTTYSADDFNKLMDLLNGVDTGQPVDLNNSFTLRNQKLYLRNPANNASLRFVHPAIPGDRDHELIQDYTYYVYLDGNTYKIKNGLTGGIDYSTGSGNGLDSLLSQVFTDRANLGAHIKFAPQTFLLNNPITPPGLHPTNSPLNRWIFEGTPSPIAAQFNTTLQPINSSSAFNNRSLIECICAAASGTKPAITIKGIQFYHPYSTTFNLGGINLEADTNTRFGDITIEKCAFTYAMQAAGGIRIAGYAFQSLLRDVYFTDVSASFTGTYDIKVDGMRQGTQASPGSYLHTDKPNFLTIDGYHASHLGTLTNSLWLNANYCMIRNVQLDGWTWSEAPFHVEDCIACTFSDVDIQDMNGTVPGGAKGLIYIYNPWATVDNTYGHVFRNIQALSWATNYAHVVIDAYAGATFPHDNYFELKQYGTSATRTPVGINEVGSPASARNTYVILPGVSTVAFGVKAPVIIAKSPDSVIIDKRYAPQTDYFGGGSYSEHVPNDAKGFSAGGYDGSGVFSSLETIANSTSIGNDSNGRYRYLYSFTANNAQTGYVILDRVFARRERQFIFTIRFIAREGADTYRREYIALTSRNSILALSDNPLADAESGIVFGKTAAGTNYQVWYNDGSGSAQVQDTGQVVPPSGTDRFLIITSSGTAFTVSYQDYNRVNQFTATYTTRIPAATTNLYFQYLVQNANSTQKLLGVRAMTLRGNY